MSKVKAVVFDLDGTLFNTLDYVVKAFEGVIKEHGGKPDRDTIIGVVGPTLVECYEILLPHIDATLAADRHHELQQEPHMAELIQVYDNLREMLDAVKKRGLICTVFTNRWRNGVEALFENTDLAAYFDIVITPEDVAKGKPEPEGLEKIAKQLNLSAVELVMFGDTTIDIQTGKNAGVAATIGITHGFGNREQLEAAGADVIIDSLAEFEAALNPYI